MALGASGFSFPVEQWDFRQYAPKVLSLTDCAMCEIVMTLAFET
jgi:hypothetical protein